MFGFITRQANSVGAHRRLLVAIEAARDGRRSPGGARRAVGLTLVTIGQRVAGEIPARPAAELDGDCA